MAFHIRALLVALCVMASSFPARATSQAPDEITLDGVEVALNTNPLEGFLAVHSDRRPRSNTVSSGLWRGYVAHWKISDNRLLLSRVETLDDSKGDASWTFKDVTAQYFPGAPLAADWYTGALVIPRGEVVNYVHMGYASTYEAYTILAIRGGMVVDRKDLPLKEFENYKKSKFERFKQTAEYAKQLKRSSKQLGGKSHAEEFLSEFYTEQYLAVADQ